MARTAITTQKRQEKLATLLRDGAFVSTEQVARRLGVSSMTIRRDLHALEQSGAAVRCYGGAIGARRVTLEFAFDQRHQRNLVEKARIGVAAARKVEDGQIVFLDTGTTTLEVARALTRRDVACEVVTSSLVVASALWGQDQIAVSLLGGRIRQGSPDLAGAATEMMLERLAADVAFLGSDGIDPSRGSFARDMESARIAERMALNARNVVVVADHSKLGVTSNVRYLKTDGMNELITDKAADRSTVAALRRRGVKVVCV